MRFRNNDLIRSGRDLTDAVTEEHPVRMAAVAEERIKAMHHHSDGSAVELHEIGSKEFISQSIASSLEGKLSGNSGFNEDEKQLWQQQNNPAAAKIEYEKTSSQNQPTQMYGLQPSVTGAVSHGQETALVGCNCGAEWTVTGQSMKQADIGPGGIKIEQYGSATGKGASGYSASGGGPAEYHAGGGQQQGYRG